MKVPFERLLTAVIQAWGLSNKQLAQFFSVDTSLVSRWKKGTRIPHDDHDFAEKLTCMLSTHKNSSIGKQKFINILENITDQSLLSASDDNFFSELSRIIESSRVLGKKEKFKFSDPETSSLVQLIDIEKKSTGKISFYSFDRVEKVLDIIIDSLDTICKNKLGNEKKICLFMNINSPLMESRFSHKFNRIKDFFGIMTLNGWAIKVILNYSSKDLRLDLISRNLNKIDFLSISNISLYYTVDPFITISDYLLLSECFTVQLLFDKDKDTVLGFYSDDQISIKMFYGLFIKADALASPLLSLFEIDKNSGEPTIQHRHFYGTPAKWNCLLYSFPIYSMSMDLFLRTTANIPSSDNDRFARIYRNSLESFQNDASNFITRVMLPMSLFIDYSTTDSHTLNIFTGNDSSIIIPLDRESRLACIERLTNLLEKFPYYQVAIFDDSEMQQKMQYNLLIKENYSVYIPNINKKHLYFIENPDITLSFQKFFDIEWENIPYTRKNKLNVVNFLKNCY